MLRFLPFSPTATPLQAITYLLGISLFSISFLVFLNSSVSFVVTDLIGQKRGVGDVVGTLGFADEIVALLACPLWGLVSDRLGVRWVAVLGYAIIGVALLLFVQAANVYPQLLLARIFFALGAAATTTMVTAILPSLTDEQGASSDDTTSTNGTKSPPRNPRHSATYSVESEATITPEIYTRTMSAERVPWAPPKADIPLESGKSSRLAGLVGLFTGCGALVALVCFLPLPAKFGELDGVTPARAVEYSFYVVGVIAVFVALFVFVGLRNLNGEEGKGWRVLFNPSAHNRRTQSEGQEAVFDDMSSRKIVPYLSLIQDSILLGFHDSRIALGYIGGFVARASTVAISLFVPLYINNYFISNGFCKGSPNDPSPELKKECRSAYILSSILTGVAQLLGLLCAPLFGYLSSRTKTLNYPIIVSTVFGIVGYIVLPQLPSPEFKNVDSRGGSPAVFFIVALLGISQIGAIVCSLGSLSRGVLAVDLPRNLLPHEASIAPDESESLESEPLIRIAADEDAGSRIRLKGSIAGVYSLSGGAAILLLTKVGGVMFDKVSNGAPFYMMAAFNAALLVASLLMDASQAFSDRSRGQ